jgi:hypothetical protein
MTHLGFYSPMGFKRRPRFSATSVIAAGGEDFELKAATNYNTIEKYNIGVIGSANTSFGTLPAIRHEGAAAASQKYGGRWLYMGGTPSSVALMVDTVSYISPKTGGAASSWGTLVRAKGFNSACANAFEAHIIGGIYLPGGFFTTEIEKLWIMNNGSRKLFGTIATAAPYARGNAYATQSMMYDLARNLEDQMEIKAFKSDAVMRVYASLGLPYYFYTAFCCNDFLGLSFGGSAGGVGTTNISQINLKTITKANAFGSLTVARMGAIAGCSQSRALVVKGSVDGSTTETNNIEYVGFKTKSNSKSFGNLGIAKWNMDAYGAA